MQKIRYVFQFLLRIFLIFLLIFIWVRFFVKKLWLAILLSILSALLVDIIIKIFTKKTNSKKQLKFKEKEDCENMFLSLATNKTEIDFFNKLASKRYKTTKHKKYILINHDDGNVVLYPFFSFSQLNPNDINEIITNTQKHNVKKIVICCGDISKETFAFIKNFEIKIILLDKFDTYKKLYKEYDYFPEITMHYKKDKKATFKELLGYSFNRSKTKNYIFSAFVLLFSSIFVRINLYYCIISSILVIFALISFFNPFYKAESPYLEL